MDVRLEPAPPIRMRLFIGIALPAEVSARISAFSSALPPLPAALRWTSPAQWHITLQFLGSTTDAQYASVTQCLAQIASPPVPVSIDGAGFFKRAGIFYAAVVVSPELLALHKQISAAMRECGFPPEDRPYSPHITLARGRNRPAPSAFAPLQAALRGAPAPSFGSFTAREFLLYQSFTEPVGSRYEVRACFPLGTS
jgi:2'-5' RNA ligase